MSSSRLPRPLRRLGRSLRHLARDQVALRRPGFRTTLEGKVFIVVTFLIGFAAYNTATNLLYLIFSMMLSLIIISAILSRSTIRGVRAERLVPTHLVAGEEGVIHLTVRNVKRWLPSLSLRVVDMLASGEARGLAYIVRVPAQGSERASYRVTFARRGQWLFDRLVIATRYPFGFIEKSVAEPQRQEVLVYPPIVDLDADLSEAQLDLGEIESGRRGLGTSLHGLRPYTHSDPARHIHWKVSAKAGEVLLREFEREEKKRVTIFLDNVAPTGDSEIADAFEWSVIYTASVCKYLIDRDYQIQLITQQGRVPFGSGPPHLGRLLRCLAIIELIVADKMGPISLPASHAADSTNLCIQWSGAPPPRGFDQVIDTRHWRPAGVVLLPPSDSAAESPVRAGAA
jgi:uncharacterized protein (DUF58 family)